MTTQTQSTISETKEEFYSAFDTVLKYGSKFIREIESSGEVKSDSYLGISLSRNELPREEIEEIIASFLMASVDTTSYSTLWLLFNLGRFPDVQEKLYQEIVSVVGDGEVTAKHLEKMDYMKQVMRETHRLTPLGPIITNRRLDHPIVLSGYEIPPGSRIDFCTNAIQQDPTWVEDPEKFIPERWTKEAITQRKGTPKEFLDSVIFSKPFSTGPRMCVGARLAEVEMKLFLCYLLRDWKFKWDPTNHKYKVRMATGTVADPYPKMEMEKRK